jgi:hypothetical protein
MTQHRFATATFFVGEGEARKTGTARDVVLNVEEGVEQVKSPAGRSPFLTGQIRAEGTFFEECRPNSSLLAVGREVVLKLAAHGRYSLVSVLLVELGEIRSPAPKQRLYQWSFLVTGKPRDALRIFPMRESGELEVVDLLELLGASADDVGKDANGREVAFDTEGGFRVGS